MSFSSFAVPKNLLILLITFLLFPCPAIADYTFTVISDQRGYAGSGLYDSPEYFRGAVLASAAKGESAFMLVPGDIDPPQRSAWTIEEVMGSQYQWFPVVGNHELPGEGTESYPGENLQWLREFDTDINGPGIAPDINTGPDGCPETTYSFDYQNSHFVILNEYCDATGDHATEGDIPDHLYSWLENDLQATNLEHIFVVGHEPAYPQPDLDNGRFRHGDDSLNENPVNRDRFWNLLSSEGVTAYFCGHTHNFSAVRVDGVWQVDSGHGRGRGDTGSPSTFVTVDVGSGIGLTVFRDIHDGNYDYNDVIHQVQLDGVPSQRTVSFQNGLYPNSTYEGTEDTMLAEHFPFTNYGSNEVLGVDGNDPQGSGNDLVTLLTWDISSIPPGSRVESASISLHIIDGTSDAYRLQALARPWSETQADWYNASPQQAWHVPGAAGSHDRQPDLLGTYAPAKANEFTFFLNHNGIRQLQAWIDAPENNHGIILSGTGGDGFDIASSETGFAALRPKLTITYSYSYRPSFPGLPWLNLLLLRH